MTIPIHSSLPGLGLPPGVDRQSRLPGTDTTPKATPVRPSAPTATPAATGLSAAPPAGVDPELWSVLSAEERGFFSRAQEMGPLTYGRRTSASAPAMRLGGRVDVRV